MSLVECRFNPNHKVKKSRILIHEMKCPDKIKKQNEFKLCPYNPYHYIKNELFEKHKLECDSRPKITNEEEQSIEKTRQMNNIATEQEEIKCARMKYYKDPIQEPQIPGISKDSMKKNQKKREKILKKKLEEKTVSEGKCIVDVVNNLDKDNNKDNPHNIENSEGELDFDDESENKYIKLEHYYKYNPNNEDKDINKYSANIINPNEIKRILEDHIN